MDKNVASQLQLALHRANFLDYPSNQEVSNVSNVRSITRNCKISYSAPTASEQDQERQQLLCVARWTVLLIATHCGYDIMKGTPTHDTSLKWLKVIVSTQKRPHTFQEGSYSKKSAWNNKTYLSSNLQFCGCTMINTFAPLKLWQVGNETCWLLS